uniref:Uncharacterized protein n=1 Tax=Vitis vinifera TaxID=29760 RepID=A5C8V1_VITVI|nr:hypothetical protein VITISV_023629 [Vitis vinifera]
MLPQTRGDTEGEVNYLEILGAGDGGERVGRARASEIYGFRSHGIRIWVSLPMVPSITPRKQSKRTARGRPLTA